jgi:hypothetical protein
MTPERSFAERSRPGGEEEGSEKRKRGKKKKEKKGKEEKKETFLLFLFVGILLCSKSGADTE